MPFGVIRNVTKNITRVAITVSGNVKIRSMSGEKTVDLAVGSCHAAAMITMINKIPAIHLRMLLQQFPDKAVRIKYCIEVADYLQCNSYIHIHSYLKVKHYYFISPPLLPR